MAITSKEVVIIAIEIIIAIIVGFLVNNSSVEFFQIKEYLPMLVIVIIILSGLGYIIYKKIDEINEDLGIKEAKQKELEDRIKRAEDLVDIKAEIKYIKDKILD